jgi:hypothetical protein
LGFVIIPAIISLLIGGVLGFRFKSPVLLPATIVVLLGACAVMFSLHYQLWEVALAAIVTITALQAGYFGGGAISFYWRVRRRRRGKK